MRCFMHLEALLKRLRMWLPLAELGIRMLKSSRPLAGGKARAGMQALHFPGLVQIRLMVHSG